ncbi:DUF5916 domain-containing protein [Cellulophaga baltica]|uniref:DUF5916 domain-containing protein n=1 Tax=Cellulophaga baltica TaxID=76594 RepID=UPI003F4ACC59
MFKFSICYLFFLASLSVLAQNEDKHITIKYIPEIPQIDGILDEGVWEKAESATKFQQYFPSDTILAQKDTDIRMFYDGTHLYVGIRLETSGSNYVTPSLKRDFRAGGNDNISLLFDTFNDGTNAFLFGINPFGVIREALISNGGGSDGGFNTSWDVKWKGEARNFDNYYTAELAIPLTSFKFKEGETKWRFNSYRFDTQNNETSTWAKIPQNQSIYSLAFMGEMTFEKPLGKYRTPIAIIPYVNTLAQKDFETNTSKTNLKFGGDAKVAIGNGMNLDITLNPDFSNVEVDNVFTNLTRFEVSLPEKRQFFVDNSDLFSSFGGSQDANPFFSRRIGIARDKDNNSIENKIIGGFRLSGKLSNDWRLGFLNLQTAEDLENEIPSNNNSMFALQRKLFSRSNIGLFFINRQAFKSYDFVAPEDRYNRVLGVDYNLASADNTWNGKFYMHKSFQHDSDSKDISTGAYMSYNSRKFNVFSDWVYIGDDFRSDLGFIRRTNIFKFVTGFERVFWPTASKINSHSFEVFPIFTLNPELDFKTTDYTVRASWGAEFVNQTEFNFSVDTNYTYLVNEFDPSRTADAIALPANSEYTYSTAAMNFSSDSRKAFSYSLEQSYGAFFNGTRASSAAEMTLRLQPKAAISLLVSYDKITLPAPYSSADFWLVSPSFEFTFSKSIFWSTLVQYSNQRNNLGFNSRVQWRFAPLSDLFIVYNDNYIVNDFEPRNRSINLKFTYWLNI